MAYLDGIRHPYPRIGEQAGLIGFAADGADGEKVGTVKAVWEDGSGRPVYVGIATGWLGLGRIHVVPARDARVTEGARRIRFPFAAEVIKAGPEFVADYALSPEGERFIRAYYRDLSWDADADFNPDPGDPSLYTGHETGPAGIDMDRDDRPSR